MGRAAGGRRFGPSGGRVPRGPPARAGPGRAAGASGPSRPRHPHDGHHVHGVLRRQGHRPGVAVRRHPPRDRRGGVAGGRSRSGAAHVGVEPLHRRPLQRPGGRARRRVPGRAARELGQLPARVPRRASGLRRVGPRLRQRPRPGRGRHPLRPRGQPPRPVGRELRAGEPADLEAGLRRPVRAPEHPPRRRLHRRAVQAPDVAGPGRAAPPVRGGPHAGRVQLGLLRALLPGPADGRPARRGARPRGRQGRPRVHAHDRAGCSRST